jgi:hypothetical protein
MNSGELKNNYSSTDGGAVFNEGTFTMSGGDITGNSVSDSGGGVFNAGTFTMSGGTIAENTAGLGGGVSNTGAFTMNGGTITGNTASWGKGVNIVSGSSSFSMSGGALVDANNDVYLAAGKTITVTGPLTQSVAATVSPEGWFNGRAIYTGTPSPGKFVPSRFNSLLSWTVDNAGLLRPDGWFGRIAQGTGGSSFGDIAVDSQGNVYAAGSQTGITEVNYGNGVSFTGSAGGTYGNAVLVKYDPQGNPVWAKGVVSGSNSCGFNRIALDASGNVYVAGNMSGNGLSYNFGLPLDITTKATTITGFILKYSPDGTPLLQKTPESASSSYAMYEDIGLDSGGNVYVSGMKYGTVDYGNGVVTSATGSDTAVLVKYDADLTAQWAGTMTAGSGYNCFFGLGVDDSGNIYTVGYHNGSSIAFGSLPALGSGYHGIIVKWDGNGNALWAKKTSGGSQSGFGKVRAYGGAVYVSGGQDGTGAYTYDSFSLTGTASTNPVLVKFNAAGGSVSWVKTSSGGVSGGFDRLAVDASGVYVTGYQTGTSPATYDTLGMNGMSTGKNPVFVHYGTDGTALDAHTIVMNLVSSDAEFLGVALRGNSIYLGGYQKGTETWFYAMGGIEFTGLSIDANAIIMRHNKE